MSDTLHSLSPPFDTPLVSSDSTVHRRSLSVLSHLIYGIVAAAQEAFLSLPVGVTSAGIIECSRNSPLIFSVETFFLRWPKREFFRRG